MTTNASSFATSTTAHATRRHRWFPRRRRRHHRNPGEDASTPALEAIALTVGHDRAAAVRSLLTEVSIGDGVAITEQLRLPRQAFFVLSGRLAITVGDRPLAVLGPGSFFEESDTTRLQRRSVPRVHPLGPVVLGVAGPLELPEIHRLVPDLATFATATAIASHIRSTPLTEEQWAEHHDDAEDVMGLGLLERIAG